MEDVLVPIFCGCILPIAVVLIISMRKKNSDDKRAEILIKAIESGEAVDADKLAEALGKPKRTPLELLNARLLRGCLYTLVGLALVVVYFVWPDSNTKSLMSLILLSAISTAVGISYLIVYFMTRNQIRDEKES
ncbi:MAG: hypothetical protein K2J58_01730 [Muribaculaceae bacterium]|nr:hypothetical protein [Muribaculaceae bacterium]